MKDIFLKIIAGIILISLIILACFTCFFTESRSIPSTISEKDSLLCIEEFTEQLPNLRIIDKNKNHIRVLIQLVLTQLDENLKSRLLSWFKNKEPTNSLKNIKKELLNNLNKKEEINE